MIKLLGLPKNFKHLEIEIGTGDLLIGLCTHPHKEKSGLYICENPNDNQPVGTLAPELTGQPITCIAEIGVSIYFRSKQDVDRLIDDLNELKKVLT